MSDKLRDSELARLDREERIFSVVALTGIAIAFGCLVMAILTAYGVAQRP